MKLDLTSRFELRAALFDNIYMDPSGSVASEESYP